MFHFLTSCWICMEREENQSTQRKTLEEQGGNHGEQPIGVNTILLVSLCLCERNYFWKLSCPREHIKIFKARFAGTGKATVM